jgi:hypothetical protein
VLLRGSCHSYLEAAVALADDLRLAGSAELADAIGEMVSRTAT